MGLAMVLFHFSLDVSSYSFVHVILIKNKLTTMRHQQQLLEPSHLTDSKHQFLLLA